MKGLMLDFLIKGLNLLSDRYKDTWQRNILAVIHETYIKDFPCYKIGYDFGKELFKTKLDISRAYLPKPTKNIIYYIEFPNDDLFNNKMKAQCCFIKTPILISDDKDATPRYFIVIPFMDNEEHRIGFNPLITSFPYEEDDGKTIEEILNDTIKEDITLNTPGEADKDIHIEGHKEFIKEVAKYALKCLIYINSGNPDLRSHRKGYVYHKNNGKRFVRLGPKEDDNHNMVYVGYNYKKHNFYNVDGCTVSGHFRWQPYGEKLSKVKLIWINEYEKHFIKEALR